MKKVLALLVVSFALSACESTSPETNSNDNVAKPSPSAQASPTPAPAFAPEASPSPASQLKAGDKVKAVNGSFSDATVVSVDEKTGKATVRIQGQTGEKTVALSEVVKQ